MKITIRLLDQENQVKHGVFSYDKLDKLYQATGEDLAVLGIKDMKWQIGEKIQVELDRGQQYVWVQIDETLMPTLVYFAQSKWIYTIDTSSRQVDTAFASKSHYIAVRKATTAEVGCYRNLALNPHDQTKDTGVYPHAATNVTDEPDPDFAAQNAINGKLANISHGSYPYGSWGIHKGKEAMLTIDFGHQVTVDRIQLLFRRDHLERPHDGFWKQVTVGFEDGTTLNFPTTAIETFQTFKFPAQITNKIYLSNLIKAEDSGEFTALTQIEVYGYNKI